MPLLSPHVSVAIILLATGLVSCFLGYRLFKWLLAAFGFWVGAYLASLFVVTSSLWTTVLLGVGGGLTGVVAVLMTYLAGIALLGAGLSALALSFLWPALGGPSVWPVIVVCLIGAGLSVVLQRYVIIVLTAFTGAWASLVALFALAGYGRALALVSGDFWQMYPMAPANGQVLFAICWFCLGSFAAFLQLWALNADRVASDE